MKWKILNKDEISLQKGKYNNNNDRFFSNNLDLNVNQ